MPDKTAPNGHTIKVQIQGDRLKLSIRSPFVGLLTDFAGDLLFEPGNLFAPAAGCFGFPNTACDTDISGTADHDPLNDDRVFGTFGGGTDAPPTQGTLETILSLGGNLLRSLLTDNSDSLGSPASGAMCRLIREAREGGLLNDLSGLAASVQNKRLNDESGTSATTEQELKESFGTFSDIANKRGGGTGSNPTSETRQDNAGGGTGDSQTSTGATTGATPHPTHRKVPELCDITGGGHGPSIATKAGLQYQRSFPATVHSHGANRVWEELRASSTHPLDTFPHLLGHLQEIAGMLYDVNIPGIKRQPNISDAAEGYDSHVILLPFTHEIGLPNGVKLRVTLEISATMFCNKQDLTSQLWTAFAGIRSEIGMLAGMVSNPAIFG